MTGLATRVLVDLTHLHPDGLSGGIKPALLEMLRWLATRRDPALHFVHVVKAGLEHELAPLLRPVDRLLTAGNLPRDLAAREGCDVVYCPFGSTALACPGIPALTLVVDLLHRDFPTSIIPEERAMRETWFVEAMLRTDFFQVISDYTARQLAHHYGVEAGRIFRTYLPLQQRFGMPAPFRAEAYTPAFFYYPANAWAHKNHRVLLQAYAEYVRSAGSTPWRLVLTGAEDDRMLMVRACAAELRISTWVDFLGYVSESRLARLWQEAGALVFPSLHEGFGIPLVEAMAHGVPIIASRATAIPEIVGPAALLVDALQPAELTAALLRVATEPALRAELATRGREQSGLFCPDREFGLLHRALVDAALRPARWRNAGYYEIDGLTDPEAVFALPTPLHAGTLRVVFDPLPEDRDVQFWSGPVLVGESHVPSSQPVAASVAFAPVCASLCLRVTNARRLSPTDPRVHGILIRELFWENHSHQVDLLSAH